jgi:hypothetical protein
MSLAIRLYPEPLRSLASGSISGSFSRIGTPFTAPSRILWVQNLTDVTLSFSLDGIVTHFQLPTNGFVLLDVTTNQVQTSGCFISQGTQIYVSGSPTMGQANVSTWFGFEGD